MTPHEQKATRIMEILKGIYCLFSFTPYTRWSRGTEITYGVLAWGNLILLIYHIIITKF